MRWEEVTPGVWRFRDSCNVYAIEGAGALLIVDAGTGAWLSHLVELPKPLWRCFRRICGDWSRCGPE